MKKANPWIVGTFLVITVFQFVDNAISGNGHLLYLSLVYLAAFVISMFMTRRSKACNLFYLIYSFILCVAIILSLLPFLFTANKVTSLIYYLAVMLTEPLFSVVAFFWKNADPVSILFGTALVYLLPFVTSGISFHFYTKNKCQQKEPGSA